MAPSGAKLGKLVHPACQHSPFAKAFLCSHLTWQDRISKERGAVFSTASLPPAQTQPSVMKKAESMTALELARHEYHPIGGAGKNNNNSGQMSLTLAPKSWRASGGLKSTYGEQVGKGVLPLFGAPPPLASRSTPALQAEVDRELRSEGRRRAHLDQLEPIQQHGEDTILRLQHGDMAPANPAEEAIFRGGVGTPFGLNPPRSAIRSSYSRGASMPGSRLSSAVSWGSQCSGASSELRRIDELGEKARRIGRSAATVNQLEAVRQVSEDAILRH